MTYYGDPKRQASVTTWISVAVMIVVGVIALVTVAAVALQSGRASNSQKSASTSQTASEITCARNFVPPNADPDCYFLYMMGTHNISTPGGAQGLIRQAHEVCAAMDQAAAAGKTPSVATLSLIERLHPEFSIRDAAYFGAITQTAYCPWDARP